MHKGPWTPFQRLTPLELTVVIYNVAICEEVDCDPDYTYEEVIKALDEYSGKFTKKALERVLFCLNMNDEDGFFWHPLDKSFDVFVREILPNGYKFDKYYNLIEKEKK